MLKIPRIIPDRDKVRDWYLDEDFYLDLPEGHAVRIRKGYRFDGHSTKPLHWLFKQHNGDDIVAALIHDYLIDTMPWHRFDRIYIDYVYEWCHGIYGHSTFRSKWMPRGVYWSSWLGRKNKYRGQVKPNTIIDVQVICV